MALFSGGSVLFHSFTALVLPRANYSQQESHDKHCSLELFQFLGVEIIARVEALKGLGSEEKFVARADLRGRRKQSDTRSVEREIAPYFNIVADDAAARKLPRLSG